MNWDELLAAYRANGGIADNVRLADGPRGRGVFPIDPSGPATLQTPESLFIPVTDILIAGREMRVKPESAVSAEARAFFEAYQRHFGWGNGGREAAFEEQAAWHALHSEVAEAIRAIAKPGSNFPAWRFDEPSEAMCAQAYLNQRQFDVRGHLVIVPLIDLVNHSGSAPSYATQEGLGVHGVFADEMLVSYNAADAWAHILSYSFASPSPLACSLSITVTLADGRKLSFERNIAAVIIEDRVRFPKAKTDGALTTFDFALLGFTQAMDLPRAVFRKTIEPYVAGAEADALFDRLHHYNQLRFIELLRTLRRHDGVLVRALEEAVLYQLEALSASVGARPL
jgi:hypothetical protein